MALVAWQLHLVVLDNVLLDDGLSCAKLTCLTNCLRIVICSWDEAVIAWNMGGCLSGSCSQFVILVESLCGISRELIPWIMPISS